MVLGLQESTGSRIVDLIDKGQMDVGFIRTPAVNNRGLTIHTLQTQRFMVVIPRGSEWEPARNTKKVRLQDWPMRPSSLFRATNRPCSTLPW